MLENQYEIEVKVLLGSENNIAKFIQNFETISENQLIFVSEESQLNHYFLNTGEIEKLMLELAKVSSDSNDLTKFASEFNQATGVSLRTRFTNQTSTLIIKYSLGEDTSENGVSRKEISLQFPNLSIEELDNLVLQSGYNLQSKWSRFRKNYKFLDFNVVVDKNAGFGYLAEIEKVTTDKLKVEEIASEIKTLISKLGFEELDQARLERMFKFYNENWPDYYGTEKIFTVL